MAMATAMKMAMAMAATTVHAQSLELLSLLKGKNSKIKF